MIQIWYTASGGQTTAKIPPGRWFVGDPLVPLPVSVRGQVALQLRYKPVVLVSGHEVFGVPVGPGVYFDQEMTGYRVDSGFLGLVPWGAATGVRSLDRLGRVVFWNHEVTVICTGQFIRVGPYTITTRRSAQNLGPNR